MPAVSEMMVAGFGIHAKLIFRGQPYPTENKAFNHVAVSVPNVEEAAAWYEKVLGFRRIRDDRETNRADAPAAPIFKIYDQKLQRVKIAWLSCGNGVGFEIFEFIDPQFKQPEAFDYARGGFFHIGVTVADPEAVAAQACEAGGKIVGEPVGMYEEKALYLQDPWGNIVELLSCSFEKLMGNRA